MKVSLKIGKTFNTGNYNSARIDVGLEDTCEPEQYDEKCKEIYDQVVDYFNAVQERIVDNV